MTGLNINEVIDEKSALEKITEAAKKHNILLIDPNVIRTSSRVCLGVEHGDYNGTDLFGFATDKYIWNAYRPTEDGRINIFSVNFQEEGVVKFNVNDALNPIDYRNKWARFPIAVVKILKEKGYAINKGIEGVILGNIPGGGMSRSASLTINLILALLKANDYDIPINAQDKMKIVDMAQQAEHAFGSSCGKLDQIMIMFGEEGKGVHYKAESNEVELIEFGGDINKWRFVVLDTGTERPGLDKARYPVRQKECQEILKAINNSGKHEKIVSLADIKDQKMYDRIKAPDFSHLQLNRLKYIYNAQQNFDLMLKAWKRGDIVEIGRLFREDGFGLRYYYNISGNELEGMCNLARSSGFSLGERMLGGGDKGASGSIVLENNVAQLKAYIDENYPGLFPIFARKYAVHTVKLTQGVFIYKPEYTRAIA